MREPEPTSLTRTTDFNARDVAVYFLILLKNTRNSTFRQIDKFEGTGDRHAYKTYVYVLWSCTENGSNLTLLIGNTHFL